MSAGSFRLALIGILCIGANARPGTSWKLARSDHFEVYSDAGPDTARSALTCFEQIRAFVEQQPILPLANRPPVRVVGFRSLKQYQPYRLRSTSDAYYVGTESRNYIVMGTLGAGEFRTAAHEYAHAIVHASGLQLPPWLNEGLAEFFSTVRVRERGSNLGGDLPTRSQTLRSHSWIPVSELLALPADSPQRDDPEQAALFYAESWALTEMLLLSPDYAPRFRELIASITAGVPSGQALTTVHSRPLEAIFHDVQTRVSNH